MRVSDERGMETEAIGPALWSGMGEVYLVAGERVPYDVFRRLFVPQPERRVAQRRSGDRRRNRSSSRRTRCRRIRDVLTAGELWALARGEMPL